MTTLYTAPGACSFAAHVAILELDLPIDVVNVPLRAPDSPIHAINPLGRVPALQLDDGVVITESSAILPFLGDLKPGLFAEVGQSERGLIQAWLGYLTAEVHTGAFRVVNRPERFSADVSTHPAIREKSLKTLHEALSHIDRHLEGKDWLVGNRFTIADAYLGVFLQWITRFGDVFADLKNLARFKVAYLARPSVQAVLAFEKS